MERLPYMKGRSMHTQHHVLNTLIEYTRFHLHFFTGKSKDLLDAKLAKSYSFVRRILCHGDFILSLSLIVVAGQAIA